jgi:hypothetical protein
MRLNFRHGLVRFQTDTANNPTFLQYTPTGVSLIVSPDPTVLAIADSDEDYIFEEHQTVSNAWAGPFSNDTQYLYIDVDKRTGVRTFITSKYDTYVGNNQPSGQPDGHHWFDKSRNTMKVKVSGRYIPVLRVCVGRLDGGSVLVPCGLGSSVGLDNINTRAGVIVFDESNNPIRRYRSSNSNEFSFVHTESPLNSQFSRLVNFRLETEVRDATATESIPKFYCVSYINDNEIALADPNKPEYPCVGLAIEDMVSGEIRPIVTHGYVTEYSWDWSQHNAGTRLFVGPTGILTTSPSQAGSIQVVASIVSKHTILVNVQPIMIYD